MPRVIALLLVGTLAAALFPRAAEAQPCNIAIRPLGVSISGVPFEFTVGQEYALRPGHAPGDYQHLDLSQMNPPPEPPCAVGPCAGVSSAGGGLLRCVIEHGFLCCVNAGLVRVQTGVSSGPVRQATDALFDDYGDVQREYPVTQANAFAAYMAQGGNGSRVVVLPLVEFVPPGCSGNNCWARIEGYAAFFLKRRYDPGSRAFYGEFLNYLVCGGGALRVADGAGTVGPGDCGLGFTPDRAARPAQEPH